LWCITILTLCNYTRINSINKPMFIFPNGWGRSIFTRCFISCIGCLVSGTYFGGVNYFNPEYEIYTRYKANSILKTIFFIISGFIVINSTITLQRYARVIT
jgi:hypothetical protein